MLEPDELERLASAAYLGGRRDDGYETWAAAHNAYVAQGDVARAARCAFWIAFGLLNSGELARGGGWIDRAQRLLDETGLDCVEHGYLRYAGGLQAIFSGDGETAHAGFTTAMEIGDRSVASRSARWRASGSAVASSTWATSLPAWDCSTRRWCR